MDHYWGRNWRHSQEKEKNYKDCKEQRNLKRTMTEASDRDQQEQSKKQKNVKMEPNQSS